MPFTMNGIGTNYWGKRNQTEVYATCEQCGEESVLRSYDTSHCFVVLFIPIIPLGQKRILDYCDSCTRHHLMPLKQWEAHKREMVEEATADYKRDPSNTDAAANLIGTLIGVRDEPLYLGAARHVERKQIHSAEIMNLLGAGYSIYQNLEDAERCYRAAVAAENRNEHREMLAVSLIRQTRADEAIPFVQHLLTGAEEEGYPLLAFTVQGLQAAGNHREALTLLEQMDRAFPELAEDPEVVKLRNISQKHEHSGKAVGAKNFKVKKSNPSKTGLGFSGLVPYLFIPAALLFFLMFTVLSSFDMDVNLVNGLNEPYRVEIQSETYDLQPYENRLIQVSEGGFSVKLSHATAGEIENGVTLKRPFLTRLFNTDTHVINPDGCALLLWEQTYYSVSPQPEDEGSYKVDTGKFHYVYKGLDYVFREFPDSVELSSSSDKVRRERLDMARPDDILESMQYAYMAKGDMPTRFFKNYLTFHPKDEIALSMYVDSASPQESKAWLESILTDRPVNINGHRAYQGLLEATQLPELLETYTAFLEEEPDNKALQYLLGRIEPDPEKSKTLMISAATEPEPCLFAYNALAYRSLSEGAFEEGLKWSEKTGDDYSMVMVRNQLILATGGFDRLLEENRVMREKQPLNPLHVVRRIQLLKGQDPKTDVEPLILEYLAQIKEGPGSSSKAQEDTRSFLRAEAMYAIGDREAYATLIPEDSEDITDYLARNQFKEASTLAAQENNPYHFLAISLLARLEDREGLSDQTLNAALSMLQKGTMDDQTLRACLLGEKPPEAILSVSLLPNKKMLALLAMAQKAPDHAEQFRNLAAKLNFDRVYPYLTVKRLLEAP